MSILRFRRISEIEDLRNQVQHFLAEAPRWTKRLTARKNVELILKEIKQGADVSIEEITFLKEHIERMPNKINCIQLLSLSNKIGCFPKSELQIIADACINNNNNNNKCSTEFGKALVESFHQTKSFKEIALQILNHEIQSLEFQTYELTDQLKKSTISLAYDIQLQNLVESCPLTEAETFFPRNNWEVLHGDESGKNFRMVNNIAEELCLQDRIPFYPKQSSILHLIHERFSRTLISKNSIHEILLELADVSKSPSWSDYVIVRLAQRGIFLEGLNFVTALKCEKLEETCLELMHEEPRLLEDEEFKKSVLAKCQVYNWKRLHQALNKL